MKSISDEISEPKWSDLIDYSSESGIKDTTKWYLVMRAFEDLRLIDPNVGKLESNQD